MVGLSAGEARERMRHIHTLCHAIAMLSIPVVSAIEGMGVGAGMGLALLGDVIVVGGETKLYFPFMKLGLVPDWGSMLTLPRRIGYPLAQKLLAESATIDGVEAGRIGLADLVVDDAIIMEAAVAKASEMARLPAEAFARLKSQMQPQRNTLSKALKFEESAQVALLQSDDFAEGYRAMREKRPANFAREQA
jgi:enoyl-CoA hydratase/carnithine racemase